MNGIATVEEDTTAADHVDAALKDATTQFIDAGFSPADAERAVQKLMEAARKQLDSEPSYPVNRAARRARAKAERSRR